MQDRHDYRISAVKAICIMLMVIGHSGAPGWIHHLIYSFHMPCFFFVSGFLLKDKYFDHPCQFVKRRVKSLYWPFVKWSFIFLLFHNLFSTIHLYENSYTIGQIANKALRIVFLSGSEQLLGGYWFLKELLFVSIIAFFSLFAITKLLKNKHFHVHGGGIYQSYFSFLPSF